MKALLTLVLCAALSCSCARRKTESHTLSGSSMGTTWTLVWRGKNVEGLEREVSAVLGKWEAVLSQWKDDSDLSRFNHGDPPSAELQRVIALADVIQQQSGGAFDYHLLKETGEAGFGPGGNGIDLSSIGKGFAADRVGERLRELGITNFAFGLAGEIVVGDHEWEVAIEKPDPAVRETARRVKLNHRALATSGNYRQFKPVPGGIASHIIDPATHKPVIRPFSSVSVIANDCATASAWGTALFVLGPEFPTPPGLEVIWNGLEAQK